MSHDLCLTGYGLSVYTRAARMGLVVKDLPYAFVECDPFEEAGQAVLRGKHPFGRVPVLEHGAFRVWETQAILEYVEVLVPEPRVTPEGAEARARMRQVMGIVDSYLYWPLVRQAFSHGVFRPLMGDAAEPGQVADGLAKAVPVLDALEEIAQEGHVLRAGSMSLCDCLLWPMLDYFSMVEAGNEMVLARPGLHAWTEWMQSTEAARKTRPDLMTGAPG